MKLVLNHLGLALSKKINCTQNFSQCKFENNLQIKKTQRTKTSFILPNQLIGQARCFVFCVNLLCLFFSCYTIRKAVGNVLLNIILSYVLVHCTVYSCTPVVLLSIDNLIVFFSLKLVVSPRRWQVFDCFSCNLVETRVTALL